MIYNKFSIIGLLILLNLYFKIEIPEKKAIESKIITSTIINQDNSEIIGTWHWRSEDKSKEFTFKIKKIIKDTLYAQYCAVSNNGNKLDCDFDDVNNLKGIIKNNKIYLNFYSFFGAKNGKAEIEIHSNYLTWKIVKAPKGDYYAPESVTLNKRSSVSSYVKEKTNEVDELYVLKTCEKSRFKIRIAKDNFSVLDNNKIISKGKVGINKNKITFGKMEGVISKDKIVIQNYVDSNKKDSNFTQCGEKFLNFEKQ
jgi:hypothetical protein